MAVRGCSVMDQSWTLLPPSSTRSFAGESMPSEQIYYSMESIRSSDLFGYGASSEELQHSRNIVKLIYKPTPLVECEELELTLDEAEVLMLEYAAVTSIDEHSPTLLDKKLQDNAMCAAKVDVTSNRDNIIISLDAVTETVKDADDFKEKMVHIIKSLSNELDVKVVEITGDKYLFAVKHFNHVFQKHPSIRMYKVDQENSIAFVIQSERGEDTRIIDEHIKVVIEGSVVCNGLDLSAQDKMKLDLLVNDLSCSGTSVDLTDDKLTVNGFEEDVQAYIHLVTRKIQTYSCEIRKLDMYIISLFKEETFGDAIISFMRKKNLKVVWKLVQENVIVVGRSKRQVELATDLLSGRLATIRDEFDLVLYKSLWEMIARMPRGATPIHGTVIKTKKALRGKIMKSIAETAGTESTLSGEGVQWRFFLKNTLKKIVENYEDLPFSNILPDEVVILKGTKEDIEEWNRRLQNVHVENLWIGKKQHVPALKCLPEYPQMPHILQVKKGVDIKIEIGRIEQKKVDVIVNSAGPNFDVNDDKTITTSILNNAGPKAKSCLIDAPKPIPVGKVIMGDSGNLTCKKILHAFLQQYDNDKKDDCKKLLKDVVHKCLSYTSAEGYRSIALPALCAGVHQYPMGIVVNTMLDAIVNFINGPDRAGRGLESVHIVCRQEDKKMAFDESVSRRQRAAKAHDKLTRELPWPTSHYCCIAAETKEMVTKIQDKINDELRQQTAVKAVI